MSWLTRLRTRVSARAAAAVVTEPREAGYATSQEGRRAARHAAAAASAKDTQERHDAGLAGRGDPHGGAHLRDVRGRPYHLWPDTVRQLKREQRLDEAMSLLLECIAAAERDRGRGMPAPWYTEHAAIIYRQRKDYEAEVAVLERWVRVTPDSLQSGKIVERLGKARVLQQKHAGTA